MSSNEKFQELVADAKGTAKAMMEMVTPDPSPVPISERTTHRIRKQEIADHLGIPIDQLEIVE